MDLESAIACLRSVDATLGACDLAPGLVLELETAGQLAQLGQAIQTIAMCRGRWGIRSTEIHRLTASLAERSDRLKGVFSQADRYCQRRLTMASISHTGYPHPGVATPLSLAGSLALEA